MLYLEQNSEGGQPGATERQWPAWVLIEVFYDRAQDGYAHNLIHHFQGSPVILFNILIKWAKSLSEYSAPLQVKRIGLIRTWLVLKKKLPWGTAGMFFSKKCHIC